MTMLSAKATVGSLRKYIAADALDADLASLTQKGLVERDGDSFQVTEKGVAQFDLAQTFFSPTNVLEFFKVDPALPTAKTMSCFELLLLLKSSGWQEECITASKQIPPYRGGSDKRVYYHKTSQRGGLSQAYLYALVASENLVSRRGEIHYFQSDAYYKALVELPVDQAALLRPGQSAASYKAAVHKKETAPRGGGAIQDDPSHASLRLEDEGSRGADLFYSY